MVLEKFPLPVLVVMVEVVTPALDVKDMETWNENAQYVAVEEKYSLKINVKEYTAVYIYPMLLHSY